MKEYGYIVLKFPDGYTTKIDFGQSIRGITHNGMRYNDYEIFFSKKYIDEFNYGYIPEYIIKKLDYWFEIVDVGCSWRYGQGGNCISIKQKKEEGKMVIISTPVRDVQPEWTREYNCIIDYNKNKLSDEFFQLDIIKLNQNN
jgi:hypothetical protein